jgi:hypothetical protein
MKSGGGIRASAEERRAAANQRGGEENRRKLAGGYGGRDDGGERRITRKKWRKAMMAKYRNISDFGNSGGAKKKRNRRQRNVCAAERSWMVFAHAHLTRIRTPRASSFSLRARQHLASRFALRAMAKRRQRLCDALQHYRFVALAIYITRLHLLPSFDRIIKSSCIARLTPSRGLGNQARLQAWNERRRYQSAWRRART